MLIIVSDIHLGDGTCGKPITPAAFQLFADRKKKPSGTARHNSWSTGTPTTTRWFR